MKGVTRILMAAVLLIAASAWAMPAIAQTSEPTTPTPDGSIQEQVDQLLEAYQSALEAELQTGEITEGTDASGESIQLLTGQSVARLDALWQKTTQQINELTARPQEQRQTAIDRIKAIENDGVQFQGNDRLPYKEDAQLERYATGKYLYLVDAATNLIVKVSLIDDRNYSVEPGISQSQLESMARNYIEQIAGDVNLETLTPSFSDKGGETFFFRWEDPSKILPNGGIPFVQVGYSRGGDLLNYSNTLSWVEAESALSILAFNEVYANGGGYWQWITGSFNTQSNAGYCYFAGWCSPTNFYYQNTCYGCTSALGRWVPNANTNVVAKAYIPSTHATTLQACYSSYYNGGSSHYEKCINQFAISNDWASITDSSLYNIRRIDLPNVYDTNSTREIAWDETWVYEP